MAMHAIVLWESNPHVATRIAEKYPLHYEVNKTFFLVHSPEISEKVAIAAGIKGEDQVDDALGVVFKLNGAYAGYAPRSIWEWLSTEEEK